MFILQELCGVASRIFYLRDFSTWVCVTYFNSDNNNSVTIVIVNNSESFCDNSVSEK